RHLGPAVTIVQKVQPSGPGITEIVPYRRRGQLVLPRPATRPQLADPGFGSRPEEMEIAFAGAARRRSPFFKAMLLKEKRELGSQFFPRLLRLEALMILVHA